MNALITGSIIFTSRVAIVSRSSMELVRSTAQAYADHTNILLDTIAKQIEFSTIIAAEVPNDQSRPILTKQFTENSLIQALFVLDERGHVLAIEQKYVEHSSQEELYGTDFSNLPIVRDSYASPAPVWNNRYISSLARDSVLAVAATHKNRTILAEISNEVLIKRLIEIKTDHNGARTLILNDIGNVILDSDTPEAPVSADSTLNQIVRAVATENADFSKPVVLGRRRYFMDGIRSETLGWTFLSQEPADMNNQKLRTVFIDIVILTGLSLLVVFILVLISLKRISSEIASLIGHAHAVTEGNKTVTWTKNGITEFDELAEALEKMMRMVALKETRLKTLNSELENRVEERTAALTQRNKELAYTVEKLRQTQNELTRSENLASLGRMVAGVAHELNTPLGNGLLSLHTIADRHETLEMMIEGGLTKSYLEKYIKDTRNGLDIALRNIERAADLVSGFKKVANDQASNQRRVFHLDEMLNTLFLTLQPTFKRSRHTIKTEFQADIKMDSYPGVLGQIVGNLVQNALLHAWDDDESGTVTIKAYADENDIEITVIDTGHGIPKESQKKIYDPFFTTDHDGEGTGLGLLIAQNGAENVLGGSLILLSPNEKGGSTFTLRIPIIAPQIEKADND